MTDEERKHLVREIREQAAEAAIAHSVPDDQADLYQLGMDLDRQHDQLQQLGQDDPVGVAMFGDRPGWVDSRLSRNPPK